MLKQGVAFSSGCSTELSSRAVGTARLGESLSVHLLPQSQDGVPRLWLVAWSVTLQGVLLSLSGPKLLAGAGPLAVPSPDVPCGILCLS